MTGGRLTDFQTFFLTLPFKYFAHLKGFFIMHANFLVKSGYFFSSGDIVKLLKMRTEFVDSLVDLSKRKWFDISILDKIPEYVK